MNIPYITGINCCAEVCGFNFTNQQLAVIIHIKLHLTCNVNTCTCIWSIFKFLGVFSSNKAQDYLFNQSLLSEHCKLDLLMKNIKIENLILITFAGPAEHFTCVPVVQSITINNSSLHLEFIATVRSTTHLIYCQSFLCLLNIYIAVDITYQCNQGGFFSFCLYM